MPAPGLMKLTLLMIQEAIASTALEHRSDCPCTVCRAAHGDEQAFAQIALSLEAAKAASEPLIPADIPQNFTLAD